MDEEGWRKCAGALANDPDREPETRARAGPATSHRRGRRQGSERVGVDRSLPETDHHRVQGYAAKDGLRSDFTDFGSQLRLRQGHSRRPENHHFSAQQHHRGRDQRPVADQPARTTGSQWQLDPGLPEYARQAEGIPGAAGQDLLPGEFGRQDGCGHTQDDPQDARHRGRREVEPAIDPRQSGSDPSGRQDGCAAGRSGTRGDARSRDSRGQALALAGVGG
ncbi:MAG: hypothetical protein AW09_004503 [Candidatus Accumulibacter phosphatis]|uniref:Uncharacterized protein n=1 Tax=Candidatus Accumulibacter phosphatis TaxID=327160 RepID=A0A084Y6R3_9PROT|nr:MAG: hypothetical protein AW09_004503 [Candidatus Accumulibacter phosphatis]